MNIYLLYHFVHQTQSCGLSLPYIKHNNWKFISVSLLNTHYFIYVYAVHIIMTHKKSSQSSSVRCCSKIVVFYLQISDCCAPHWIYSKPIRAPELSTYNMTVVFFFSLTFLYVCTHFEKSRTGHSQQNCFIIPIYPLHVCAAHLYYICTYQSLAL